MPDRQNLGTAEIVELMRGAQILFVVQRQSWPARRKLWPRGDDVAGKESPPIGPPERETARGMSRRGDHLERSDVITRLEPVIDLTGRVSAQAKGKAELQLSLVRRDLRA